jgi:hypothetical protein
MKIAQLSRLLDSLIHGLDGIAGASVTSDLRSFDNALQPFADATVVEFTKFLGEFGQAFKETGKITPQGKIAMPKPAKTPKPDSAQLVAAAASSIRALLKEIDFGSVDEYRVDQVVQGMSKLSIVELYQVLSDLHIAEKPKSKAKILAKIKEVIHQQMEAHAKAASVGASRNEYEPVGAAS